MTNASSNTAPLHFRARHRLAHALEFQAVYDAQMRGTRGPMILFSLPNARQHHRLGLAIGSRLGPAHVRSRYKRLVRESFRLHQAQFPKAPGDTGYDLIVSFRGSAPHAPPITLDRCAETLRELVVKADQAWRKKLAQSEAQRGASA